MQARPSSTPGRFRSLVGLGLGVVLVLLLVAGYRSYSDLEAARSRKSYLEESIRATEAHIQALEATVEELRSEPEAIESAARRELGMIRPGDVVIVLQPPQPAETPVGMEAPPPSAEPRLARP